MDFFKSVLSDDPQPSSDSPKSPRSPQDPNPNPNPSSNSTWTFGTLIKTLASKSESVVSTYRHEIDELRSGLKKETAVIREAASRAVKDLPASLEIGASVAQESLESVGQAFDDISSSVWKSTAVIISHGKDTLLAPSDQESDYDTNNNNNNNNKLLSGLDVKRYSRFEMQVRAVQCDESTYCTEPEDKEEYEKWRLGFVFDERVREVDDLISENGVVRDIYRQVVLSSKVVDGETFWSRYFFRVYKLKQAEDARAKLVKRAISGGVDEEEDLSWDFDDEDEEGNNGSLLIRETSGDLEGEKRNDDGKVDNGESSCKDSDVSIVSSQPSMAEEEEDLGWDEIEDTGSNDESKGEGVGSTSRADLHKRLSVAEEEEDLSWDIEDDDEPVKP